MTGAGGQADRDRDRDSTAVICESESIRAELVAVVQDLAAFVAAIRIQADTHPEQEGP